MLAALDLLYEQVEISQTDAAVITTDLTTYTFSGMELGAAHSNRKILVFIAGKASSSQTINTVTIGGISASLVTDGTNQATTGPAFTPSVFYIATVTTGTNGDVVVTFSSTILAAAITVYRSINTRTQAYHVQIDTSTTTEANTTINKSGFGAVVGGFRMDSNDSNPRTATWVGLTEDVDNTIETDRSYSSAYITNTHGGSLEVIATASGAVDSVGLITVSLQP